MVVVQIVPAPLERTLRERPVHLRNLAPGCRRRRRRRSWTCGCAAAARRCTASTPDDVAAYVDLAGLGAGEYTLTVHADAPPDAGVARVDPATVQVRITSVKN